MILHEMWLLPKLKIIKEYKIIGYYKKVYSKINTLYYNYNIYNIQAKI